MDTLHVDLNALSDKLQTPLAQLKKQLQFLGLQFIAHVAEKSGDTHTLEDLATAAQRLLPSLTAYQEEDANGKTRVGYVAASPTPADTAPEGVAESA